MFMDKKIQARRRVLRTLALGSGVISTAKNLPDTWSRPVINSVVLPAHAQTSSMAYSATGVVQLDSPLDMLVPRALANSLPKNICINVSNGQASVQVQYGDPGPVYTGSGSLPFSLVLSPNDANNVSITGNLDTNANIINGEVTAGGSTAPYSAPAVPGVCSLTTTLPAASTYTFSETGQSGLDIEVPIGATQVKITCVGGQGGGGGGAGSCGGGGGGGGGASAVLRSGSLIASGNGGEGGDGGDAPSNPGSNGSPGATTVTTVAVSGGQILKVFAALGGIGGTSADISSGVGGDGGFGAGAGGTGTSAGGFIGGAGGAGGVGSATTGGTAANLLCRGNSPIPNACFDGSGGPAGDIDAFGNGGAPGSVSLEWL
jgi:hypothetical protein